MLNTTGITKDTPFVIIYPTLKSVSKRTKYYSWYNPFLLTLAKAGEAAKIERSGKKVPSELKKEIFEALKKYSFTTTFDNLEKGKVYDFNDLQEHFKQNSQEEQSRRIFGGLVESVSAMKKLQEDELPRITKKGYGVKFDGGALIFTKEMRDYKIAKVLKNAFLVYPSWVATGIVALAINTEAEGLDKQSVFSEVAQQCIEKYGEPYQMYEAQTEGKYSYYVFLPKNDLRIFKIVVMGKKYRPNDAKTERLDFLRAELKIELQPVVKDLEAATKARDFIVLSIRQNENKKKELEKAMKSPSVKMSEALQQFAAIEEELKALSSSKKDAEYTVAKLQNRKDEIIQQAKAG